MSQSRVFSTAIHDHVLTSESVTEGHPDKVCDLIADSILDAHLAQDPDARVAVEVMAKSDRVIVAGEVTSHAKVDIDAIVRRTVRGIGYTDPTEPFADSTLCVESWLTQQAPEIARGVTKTGPLDQGAGDQGIIFGYATDETPELLPLPLVLAHAITRTLARARSSGAVPWLRPDGKAQVTVAYDAAHRPVALERVLVAAQHSPEVPPQEITLFVARELLPVAIPEWYPPKQGRLLIDVNAAGTFVQGGPGADCGVTGRKIVVDTYGGAARHGGGAFSGKDPSKVDRSAAYFARWAACQVVRRGLASRVELQVSYSIGRSMPQSIQADTFGTGDRAAVEQFVRQLDFRPGAIIKRLGLRRPIYAKSTNYGHFGRPDLPWESDR